MPSDESIQHKNCNSRSDKLKIETTSKKSLKFQKIYCLLLLGPGASSAGGSFVPTAPMGGSDE